MTFPGDISAADNNKAESFGSTQRRFEGLKTLLNLAAKVPVSCCWKKKALYNYTADKGLLIGETQIRTSYPDPTLLQVSGTWRSNQAGHFLGRKSARACPDATYHLSRSHSPRYLAVLSSHCPCLHSPSPPISSPSSTLLLHTGLHMTPHQTSHVC